MKKEAGAGVTRRELLGLGLVLPFAQRRLTLRAQEGVPLLNEVLSELPQYPHEGLVAYVQNNNSPIEYAPTDSGLVLTKVGNVYTLKPKEGVLGKDVLEAEINEVRKAYIATGGQLVFCGNFTGRITRPSTIVNQKDPKGEPDKEGNGLFNGWALEQIGAVNIDYEPDPNFKIGVIDLKIPDPREVPRLGSNIVFDDMSPNLVPQSHGVAVAGTICGKNNLDYRGVLPNGWIKAIGVAPNFSEADLIYALQNCIGDPTIRVINLSFQGNASLALCNAIRVARNKVIVVTAGANPGSPTVLSRQGSVSVGVSTRNRERQAEETMRPDVYAPGAHLPVVTQNNELTTEYGTSFAAPHVAAQALRLIQEFPNAPINTILRAIVSTSGRRDHNVNIVNIDRSIRYMRDLHLVYAPSISR